MVSYSFVFIVVDSFGKPPSGILEGAFDWPGEFVECTNSSNSAANWTAKYCSVSTDDKSKPQGPNSQKIFFTYGLCAPFVCSRDDIASALNFGKITTMKVCLNNNLLKIQFYVLFL